MSQSVPLPKLAVKMNEAARMLGIGKTQMWRLCAMGRIKKTSYGTIPVAELERHLKEEAK